MKAIFVTGTDTEVGKTVICGLLGRYCMEHGYRTVTQKPVQTGIADGADDIETHLQLMGLTRNDRAHDLADMNPYRFALGASAHLAAVMEDRIVDPEIIKAGFMSLAAAYDTVIVEGLGGALVPISETTLLIDIAANLALPVLIVVKNKLGAINHALLTIEAIKTRHMRIVGLIFNGAADEDAAIARDNPRIITTISGVPVLGTVPWTTDTAALYAAFEPVGKAILKGTDASKT